MTPPVPVLEVYYASTCAPCRLELPVLAQAARNGTPITVIVLSEESRARRELAAAAPELERSASVPASTDPRAVLRAAGDTDGILPFARVPTATGGTCRSWRGTLTLDRIRRLLAACQPGGPKD